MLDEEHKKRMRELDESPEAEEIEELRKRLKEESEVCGLEGYGEKVEEELKLRLVLRCVFG